MNPSNEHRAREIVIKAFDSVHRFPDAKAICERLEADIASALSSHDTEVREVLEGLRYSEVGWCWCKGPGHHSKACEAARALYAKLQPKESSDVTE